MENSEINGSFGVQYGRERKRFIGFDAGPRDKGLTSQKEQERRNPRRVDGMNSFCPDNHDFFTGELLERWYHSADKWGCNAILLWKRHFMVRISGLAAGLLTKRPVRTSMQKMDTANGSKEYEDKVKLLAENPVYMFADDVALKTRKKR